MKLLCDAVMSKNTTIYAVQLDDGTGVSPVLPVCASGSSNFFMLSKPSEIDTAFTQIGTSLWWRSRIVLALPATILLAAFSKAGRLLGPV